MNESEEELEYFMFSPNGFYTQRERIQYLYKLCNTSESHRYSWCNETIFIPTDYSGYEENLLDRIIAIVVPILFSIAVIVGGFGNSLVILVIASNRSMRNTTNILIINLAVSDLMFLVFCVPFTATDYALPSWPFGNIWCKCVQYLICVTAYASVYTLVLMSVDRYLAVVHPVSSISIRTEGNTYIAIAVMWVAIILACIPVALSHGEYPHLYYYGQSLVCRFMKEGWNQFAYQFIFTITSYAIPLFIIIVLYFMVLKKVRGGTTKSTRQSQSTSANTRRRKQSVTRMIVVVIVIFSLCWGPIHIILNMKGMDKFPVNKLSISLQIAAQVLAYMNSCMNPILYAFLSENFRSAFKKVITFHRTNVLNQELAMTNGRNITKVVENRNGEEQSLI